MNITGIHLTAFTHHQHEPFCLPIFSVHRVDVGAKHEDACLPTVINDNALLFAPLKRSGIAVSRKKRREIATSSRSENQESFATKRTSAKAREHSLSLRKRENVYRDVLKGRDIKDTRNQSYFGPSAALHSAHHTLFISLPRRRLVLLKPVSLDSCRNHGVCLHTLDAYVNISRCHKQKEVVKIRVKRHSK